MLSTTVEPPVMWQPGFLDKAESEELFAQSRSLPWSRGEFKMYGRLTRLPREEVLYGDDLDYRFRGEKLTALPWPEFLLEVKDRIQELSGFRFHFAVGNRYVDGRDSIGWHADSLPQIGKRPPIASLSLGATRRFKLKREGGPTFDYDLTSGTLLIMLPGCQEEWLHAVLKTSKPVGERINWTFRPHIDGMRSYAASETS